MLFILHLKCFLVLFLFYETLSVYAMLLHGCFSRFLNCTNGTKSRNAPHMFNVSIKNSKKHLWIFFWCFHCLLQGRIQTRNGNVQTLRVPKKNLPKIEEEKNKVAVV